MEAASVPRELERDKAARIIEAMAASVARRGIAGSTFDHVARDAGVSRGLLHYYFATKERLLVEVVRRECDKTRDLIQQGMAAAANADDVVAALVQSFQDIVNEGPGRQVLFFEIVTLAQRNADVARELASLGSGLRSYLAEVLREKAAQGVLELRVDPDAAATFLLAVADGLMVRLLSEPQLEIRPGLEVAVGAARALLG